MTIRNGSENTDVLELANKSDGMQVCIIYTFLFTLKSLPYLFFISKHENHSDYN